MTPRGPETRAHHQGPWVWGPLARPSRTAGGPAFGKPSALGAPRLSSGLGRDGVKGLRPVSLTSPHARWRTAWPPSRSSIATCWPIGPAQGHGPPHLPCLTCRRLASWAYLAGLGIRGLQPQSWLREIPSILKGVWLIGRSSSVPPGKDNEEHECVKLEPPRRRGEPGLIANQIPIPEDL